MSEWLYSLNVISMSLVHRMYIYMNAIVLDLCQRLGSPGVEFYAELKSDIAVNQLFFLPDQVCIEF